MPLSPTRRKDPSKWEAKQILDYLRKLDQRSPLPQIDTRVLLYIYTFTEISKDDCFNFNIGQGRLKGLLTSLHKAGYIYVTANGRNMKRYYTLDQKGFNLIQNLLK